MNERSRQFRNTNDNVTQLLVITDTLMQQINALVKRVEYLERMNRA